MKTKTLQIAYADYQPGKHLDGGLDFAFQSCDTKGWLAQDDAKSIIHDTLANVMYALKPGDRLSVTIEVQTREEGETR